MLLKNNYKQLLLLGLCSILALYATAQTRTYAVVVGCSKYATQPLNYCHEDAKLYYNYLVKSENLMRTQIKLLTDAQATKENIVRAMHEVYAKANKEDRLIFFFSGHGVEGAFCPIDVGRNSSSLLSHSEIKSIFKQYPAKYKICIADACFAGSIYTGNSNSTNPATSQQTASTSTSVLLMMSSQSYETSLEPNVLRHGAFSYYFVRGLEGKADRNKDKVITVKELFGYVKANVENFTKKRQKPFIEGNVSPDMPIGYLK